jgi:predicted RNase H-like HicB family nuclease
MDTRVRAAELANRPYVIMTSVEETTDDHPIYFARVLEMDGCFGQGETRDAAIEDLRLAMQDFIESLIEDGLPVPEPTPLLGLTLGTAIQGAFTFTKQGNNLQPKPAEVNMDEYFLTAQAA